MLRDLLDITLYICGFILVICGAWSIHPGLGLALAGAGMMRLGYAEYD